MAEKNKKQENKETEKKGSNTAPKKKVSKKTGKIGVVKKSFNYFLESKEELKKVTWPTRKEAINYTILVIIISAVAAVFLGSIDFALTKGLNELLKK